MNFGQSFLIEGCTREDGLFTNINRDQIFWLPPEVVILMAQGESVEMLGSRGAVWSLGAILLLCSDLRGSVFNSY